MQLENLFQSTTRGTFLDVEACAVDLVPAGAVAVIGCAGATPYASAGSYCAQAPAAIRAASGRYATHRHHFDFDLGAPMLSAGDVLVDCGDIPFDAVDFAANRARIDQAITTVLARGAVPLVLGGDDSVQVPVLAAFARRGDITVLQIDAHIDWRDEVQGERHGLSSTMRRASELDGVASIVQVGARGIGSARASDVADARAAGVVFVDMRAVRAKGIAHVGQFIAPTRPVVVCLDVDALDPAVVPGVIGRAPGGLSFGDVVELLHAVSERAPIAGFNIVEFVPENDVGGLGVTAVSRLAMLAVGMLKLRRSER